MSAHSTHDREERILRLGGDLLDRARAHRQGSLFHIAQADGLLHSLMADDSLRTQALRFVDALPSLTDDADLVRHLEEYLGGHDIAMPIPGLDRFPGLAAWGMRHARRGLAAHLLAAAVRATTNRLSRRFIAAAPRSNGDRSGGAGGAEAHLRRLRAQGMAFTLDLLGEATLSEAEATQYQQTYLRLLEGLARVAPSWPANPLLDRVAGRPSPRVNLSVKVSSLYSQLDPADPDGSVAAAKARLRPILLRARELGAFIYLDMEQYDTKAITIRLFQELLNEPELCDWPDAGLVLQAYLRDTEADLAGMIAWATRRGTPVTIRLVRGAYWDYETILARQQRWPVPVWTHKSQTDANYERCLTTLLANHKVVEPAIATHNARSIALGMTLAQEMGLSPQDYEFQMLHGMADPLKLALVERGQRLRVYVPIGELLPGMAYLVRRLLENTSSQSFVRMGFADHSPAAVLLAPPEAGVEDAARAGEQKPAPATNADLAAPFANEPVRRFTDAGERNAFHAAIGHVQGQLGRDYPLIIAGQKQSTVESIISSSPTRPDQIVGRVAAATPDDARRAIAAAAAAFPGWRNTPARDRATLLLRAAAALRRRRDELSAWELVEAGKTWREADADVCEAIDFLEYYARGAVRLSEPIPLNAPGELNSFFYEPRGIGAIIAPWNFPLAILTGMTSAAVAVGNTVVVKPAPQTPVVAAMLIQAFEEAGLPPGVVNFLPGPDAAGEALVRDPRVHFIAFTGSEAVGKLINEAGARIESGQDHLKRVIAEMGGKNAIIVDSDADVDDAVRGTIASAFGYQGQKCSAASRCIVVGALYEPFIRRLVEAAASLRIGDPADPATAMGPIIDGEARERILAAITEGKKVARMVLDGTEKQQTAGYFLGPTIFADVPPDSALGQQEIFGPVLAVMAATDFYHAIELANGTRYALTGGVYSRSPAHLEHARRGFRVGNLYLNRKTTGAVVGRQPFGGLKMSGIGSKSGGPDYLLQFVEPRAVTENTIRRGFAPE